MSYIDIKRSGENCIIEHNKEKSVGGRSVCYIYVSNNTAKNGCDVLNNNYRLPVDILCIRMCVE